MTTKGTSAPNATPDSALVAALRAVLADRERELLLLKGPCSLTGCRLHRAHSGPCDEVIS